MRRALCLAALAASSAGAAVIVPASLNPDYSAYLPEPLFAYSFPVTELFRQSPQDNFALYSVPGLQGDTVRLVAYFTDPNNPGRQPIVTTPLLDAPVYGPFNYPFGVIPLPVGIPEPASLFLAGVGLLLIPFLGRRRNG